MPERVKKLEGQVETALTDLERISVSLTKLEKMGCDFAKIADALGRLVGTLEGAVPKKHLKSLRTEGKATSHSIFLAVKTCSKALLAHSRGYGKSPCFSEVAFLPLLGVDAGALKLVSLNGADFLERAF